MVGKTDRKAERERRHARVRTKISGTAERPRLCVYRSNKNLFVQVIDDVNGTTLATLFMATTFSFNSVEFSSCTSSDLLLCILQSIFNRN